MERIEMSTKTAHRMLSYHCRILFYKEGRGRVYGRGA